MVARFFLFFLSLVAVRCAPNALNVNEQDLVIDPPLYSACSFNQRPTQLVACEIQDLNVTDPPSIYNFRDYPSVWTPVICNLLNVTLKHRVDLEEEMNFCKVPLRGADGFLAMSIGLLAACLLLGKFSTVYVLITGVVLGTLNYYVNLLELGNAIAIWLSFRPGDLFLYAFLPPLIVDSALNLELYMFRKVFVHSIMLAVVMVILTAIILTPLILFVLGFDSEGWTWVYGAIFAAIIAPTDAIAVSSVLKKARGPAVLTVILEGESLLNDASGITLFEVLFDVIVKVVEGESTTFPSVWSVIPTIIKDILKLSAIGIGIGLGFSIVSLYLLKIIRWRGIGLHVEATYVLAMAYMTYYVSNAPAGGSGVIAVVTFGLFGNATSLWGMTGSSLKTGQFKAIWEMIAFAANGLVFFWAGLSAINFLIRSLQDNPQRAMDYAAIPLIYIFMLLIRTFCIAIFNPIFKLCGRSLSVSEIFFLGWSGLRGAVSLILLTYISGSRVFFEVRPSYSDDGNPVEIPQGLTKQQELEDAASNMALWTSCFVVLTLVLNGPAVGPLLSYLRLNKVELSSLRIQAQAKDHVFRHAKHLIESIQEEESFQGADWEVVQEYTDLKKDLDKFGKIPNENKEGKNAERKVGFFSRMKSIFISSPIGIWTRFCALMKSKKDKKQSSNEVVNDDVKKQAAISDELMDDQPIDLDSMMSECPYQSAVQDGELCITVDGQIDDDDNEYSGERSHTSMNHAEIDPSILLEMRSRIISGIQHEFNSRRNQGTISRDAFRILNGACTEEIDEPKNTILIWSKIMKNIKPGWITSAVSSLALRGANHYSRYPSYLKRIFYYPHKMIAKMFMQFLGNKMLIGCEVALEYAAALDSSSQMKWLEIQGDHFVQLFSEMVSESNKARTFILDRKLEAPGTFRSIQSYRAAIAVFQGLEEFNRDLASSGIVKSDESEYISEKINRKIQRLEIIGPTWKGSRLTHILGQIKPFSMLTKKGLATVWSIGTMEEYKPNTLIPYQNNDSIIYVLHGVCKRTKRVGAKVSETYIATGESCGLPRALLLAPMPGQEELLGLGNALGRGPLVFRITRQDMEKIVSKIDCHDSEMCRKMMDGWMKVAAAYTLADLFETEQVMNQLINCLDLKDLTGNSAEDDMMNQPNFSVDLDKDSVFINNQENKEVAHIKAKQAVQKLVTLIKIHIEESMVKYLKLGEEFYIDSTTILLRGEAICLTSDNMMRAPHVECWAPDFSNNSSLPPVRLCQVMSDEAIIFFYKRD